MGVKVRCSGCGREAEEERIGFRAMCDGCGAFLHACLNCGHHDRQAYHECRAAATAEYVSDKAKYNFCEEFRAAARDGGGASPSRKSRADIEKLFPPGGS